MDVRIVRIWLLILLAVLLPIRGAVSASMLCANELPPPVHQHHHDVTSAHGTDGNPAEAAAHHMEQDSHHGAGHDHGGTGHADKCNLCAACCTGTPFVSGSPILFEPLEADGLPFPSLTTAAPSFLSDGQERPPRSI